MEGTIRFINQSVDRSLQHWYEGDYISSDLQQVCDHLQSAIHTLLHSSEDIDLYEDPWINFLRVGLPTYIELFLISKLKKEHESLIVKLLRFGLMSGKLF